MNKEVTYFLVLAITLVGMKMFLFGPFPDGSWKKHSYVSPGEYRTTGYDSLDHQAYQGNSIIPAKFTGQPPYIQHGWGGPHDFSVVDTNGVPYFSGSNEGGQDGFGNTSGTCAGCMVSVTTDSASNTILPIRQILMTGTNFSPFFTNVMVSTYATGGIVYIAGNLQGGLRGNGTAGASAQSKFVIVPMPNGDTIVKVDGIYSLIALTSQGRVLTWGDGNYAYALGQGASPVSNAPGYITIPSGYKAYDVASNSVGSWVLIDSSGVKKKILTFGWQFDPAYQGRGASGGDFTTPQDVTNNNFVGPMTKNGHYAISVESNNESYYMIRDDHTLWDIGGNAVGTIGNGDTMNLQAANYFWNQAPRANDVDTIYNVAPGITDWEKVYTGHSNSWFVYAQRSNGKLYGWGNNKGGNQVWNGIVEPNFVSNAIATSYPNSWCVPYPQEITWPGTNIVIKTTTSPFCVLNPGGSPCNTYSNPVAAAPTCSATGLINIGGSVATLTGTATPASTYFINFVTWTQISGPTKAAIAFPGIITTPVSNLVPGLYQFRLDVVDNNWRTASSTVTTYVNSYVRPPGIRKRTYIQL